MATKQRSPNYPSLGLDGAVEAAKALYKREGRTAVPPEVAVKAWGFTTLSGNARSRLAGVRQYGLLENDSSGRVRLSQRGLTLAVAEPSSTEYQRELREAALEPDIFQELYQGWREASDETLRHHLIVGRKFSEDGARRLIDAFRTTLDVANLDDPSYDEVVEIADEAEKQNGGERTGNGSDFMEWFARQFASMGQSVPVPPQDQAQTQNPMTPQGQQVNHPAHPYSWPLPPSVTADITFRGMEPTSAHIAQLIGYLEHFKSALEVQERNTARMPPRAQPSSDTEAPTSDENADRVA